MPFLLDLPTELRLDIYDWLLEPHWYLEADNKVPVNPSQPSPEARENFKSLLLSCKTVHHEAAPAFYKKCTIYPSRPYDFANTFLRRLTMADATSMDKLVSIRHLVLKLDASRDSHEMLYQCIYTKGERQYWMDLVRVFGVYKELGCLDSVILILTRTRSNETYSDPPNFIPAFNVHRAWYDEREARRMEETGRYLNRRHLRHHKMWRVVEDRYAKDIDPASGICRSWKPQRIFKIMLLR